MSSLYEQERGPGDDSIENTALHTSIGTTVNAVNNQPNITTAFKPLGPITLFNYLTPITDRVDWYRSIMRIFLQRSREYRYQLTAQDILESLQTTYSHTGNDYTLDACKNDLARLASWGNLSTLYDTSRVTTITDFRSPVLLYQATQEALALETFLAEQTHIGASEGGLYQGDLPRIWEALQQLDSWLREPHTTFTSERSQQIAEQWRVAFTTWERVTNDAAQYLGSMNRSGQHAINIDAFLNYKSIVVLYVQSFAQQLVDYSHSIRLLVNDWSHDGIQDRLTEIVSASPPPSQLLAENQDLWRIDVERQINALIGWFTREINVSMFLQAAHDAVAKVVQRAHLLATSMRPQTDYVGMLYTLGTHLLSVNDFESAQTLFAASFANTLPIHLPEGITGAPVIAQQHDAHSAWQSPPSITRTLRPNYHGAVERNQEQPMRQNGAELLRLRQEYEQEIHEQQQRFAHLFQTDLLDIGSLHQIRPLERQFLTAIIDACLTNPAHEYTLPDGATVTLINPRRTTLYRPARRGWDADTPPLSLANSTRPLTNHSLNAPPASLIVVV